MTTKKKATLKTFNLMFRIEAEISLDGVSALTLEEAITKGRQMGLGEFIDFEGAMSWSDGDAWITGAYEA